MKKVWFPREVLPLASVGAALVHFFLQSLVLFAAIAIVPVPADWGYVWLVVPALVDAAGAHGGARRAAALR